MKDHEASAMLLTRALLAPVLASCILPACLHAARADEVPSLEAVLIAPTREQTQDESALKDVGDVESALRRVSASSIRRLTGRSATADEARKALGEIARTAAPGSAVLLHYAGEGGADDRGQRILRLSGSDTMLLRDLEILAQNIEAKGARVALVLDTCFGGQGLRDVDARAEGLVFRCEPTLQFAPAQGAAVALRISAAADGVRVPVMGMDNGDKRGALSYALARGLEGGADRDGDGTITAAELRSYVTDLAYQISDQRQLPTSSAQAPDMVLARAQATRGFVVRPTGATDSAGVSAPEEKPSIKITPLTAAPRIKITALNSSPTTLQEITPAGRAEVIDSIDGADLIWDAARREALVGGDVIAQKIDRSEIPSVIERVAAGKVLKQRATEAPLAVRVTPAEGRNRRGSIVSVQIEGVARRNMILMNVTGNGTVQMLYPRDKEPIFINQPTFRMSYRVEPPYGADLFVAMSSGQDLTPLRDALQTTAGPGAARHAMETLAKLAPADMKVGAANVFTTQ